VELTLKVIIVLFYKPKNIKKNCNLNILSWWHNLGVQLGQTATPVPNESVQI